MTYEITIKDLVKDGKHAEFTRYSNGNLYYVVFLLQDAGTYQQSVSYEFPVPVSDIGNATFNATEKALLLMRYIRKAMEENTLRQLQKNETKM